MEFKTFTHLARLKDMAIIMARFGFGDIIQRLDLPVKHLMHSVSPETDTDTDVYQRIRMVIEELGPTFVKLGQILSMRPDILPVPMIRELTKLQDAVGTISFDEVKQVLEQEFDTPLEKLFRSFDPKPLAAASLSQVHKAIHPTLNRVVAVKVRRPGIVKTVETDLSILEVLAEKIHNNMESMQVYDLPGIVAANRRTLLKEMDFSREGRYIQIAKSKIETNSDIVIPDVFTEYNTPKVLVTAFIKGTKITSHMDLPVEERKALAVSGMQSAVLQILEHGFYHADPHPGNMVITVDKRLCLMDWGMVGRLTPEERNDLLFFIRAAVDKDSRKLAQMVLSITTARKSVNARQLEKDLMEIMDVYLSLPLKQIRVGSLLEDLVGVLKSHALRLPADMSIVIKALITVEGTARMLYPELDVISEAKPHVRRLVSRQYSKGYIWQRLRNNVSAMWGLQQHLPQTVSTILKKIEHDNVTIGFDHKNLNPLQKALESSFNRLTLGIVLGAMIMGSSMIITTGVGPLLFGYPALGMAGYLISAVIGLWLIITIIRGKEY
ncbi:ABC1 kinase family protein [Desulfotignum balticum]|uniref:ABC1 kinase family protein n=1 Tax=Desulfotignum balticum TaxID=115781 RepID=UPI0004A39F41|nr:AarF/UbiB family protein [Desulfotignum balticum]